MQKIFDICYYIKIKKYLTYSNYKYCSLHCVIIEFMKFKIDMEFLMTKFIRVIVFFVTTIISTNVFSVQKWPTFSLQVQDNDLIKLNKPFNKPFEHFYNDYNDSCYKYLVISASSLDVIDTINFIIKNNVSSLTLIPENEESNEDRMRYQILFDVYFLPNVIEFKREKIESLDQSQHDNSRIITYWTIGKISN